MQGGKYVGRQIERRLRGEPPGEPFKYFDKGTMATISRFHAVASVGQRMHFSGFFAWLMWLAVHVMYLIGFKNRLTTMLHWAVSFIFRGRSQRTTTRQQIVARTLMARLESTEEALKQGEQEEAAAPEPSAAAAATIGSSGEADSQSETGTDSVDQLTAAYGEKQGEAGEAPPPKQPSES
jgi:NADH dehydrogenase